MHKSQAKPELWIVVGPTASGKTALAISLAQILETAIISFDSRQFYLEMNIGTAKPSKEELSMAQHHFISNKSIHHPYSSGAFASEAEPFLSNSNKEKFVLVGGSGLYLNALLYPFHDLPEVEPSLRESVIQRFETEGLDWLKSEVSKLDPVSFQSLDSQNPQRLMRVLEICLQSGKTYSESLQDFNKKIEPKYKLQVFGIDWPRELLYERINNRVDLMMQSGLLEEAQQLFEFRHLKALQTVGYAELFQHLEGAISLEEATELIKRNSRRYAKRQLTWFRNQKPEVQWHSHNQLQVILDLAEKASLS
jgi:tRNA dimethylallyltransferase